MFPFQFNTLEPDPTQKGKTWYKPEPAYNTFISVKPKEKFLVRWVNMGFQSHPMHQHGWHMQVIGTDGMPLTQPYMKFTLHIGSGETYDTITIADPVYGVTVPSGAPLSQKEPGQENSNWPVIYPIHDHNDFQVTTNGIYPGGAVILMAVSDVPNPLPISWFNPYDKTITELGSNKILKKMGVPAENPSQTPPKNPQDGESNPKNTKN
ncbi:MAG: hypothetical protein NTX88_04965 [Candidatus Atribacteria bacterium]|nr:hypothetical protein [Candidatus Atribacteria bacterium]